MKLHVFPASANSHGCIAILKKLGLNDIEIVDVPYGQTKSEEFLAINPCHTCPTLELDNGVAIWESNAIMRYLCRSAPDGAGTKLYPSDPSKAAQIDMVMDWRQCSFYPCIPAIAYVAFGFNFGDDAAKAKFASLRDEHFKTLTDVFLKDTKFVYSDTPTIADLSIGPCLSFLKARSKFWEAVPQDVKDYHQRVLDAFPETKTHFDILDDMCTGFDGEGADLDP